MSKGKKSIKKSERNNPERKSLRLRKYGKAKHGRVTRADEVVVIDEPLPTIHDFIVRGVVRPDITTTEQWLRECGVSDD